MTLLEAISGLEGTPEEIEAEIARLLESGELELTGNFRGHEKEIAAQYAEAA